jgi:hypothetical protein
MITKHDKFLVRHYSVLSEKKKLVGLHLGIFGVCCNVKSRWSRGQFYEDVLGLNHVLWWSYDISLSQVCLPNRISAGGVMVSVLASSAVDRGFEPRSVPTKDYKFGICCFSFKHATLRRKSKDWLARNQDNVSECCDMSIHELLFQSASTIKIQLSVLV